MVSGPCPTWRWVATWVLQGLSWELFCLTSLSVTYRRGWRIHASRLQMTLRVTHWFTQGLACHPGGAGAGGERGWEGCHKIQHGQRPSSVPGRQSPAGMQARTTGLGRSSEEMAPGPGRQQAELGLGDILRSKPAWIILWICDCILWFDPTWLPVCSFLLSVFIYESSWVHIILQFLTFVQKPVYVQDISCSSIA